MSRIDEALAQMTRASQTGPSRGGSLSVLAATTGSIAADPAPDSGTAAGIRRVVRERASRSITTAPAVADRQGRLLRDGDVPPVAIEQYRRLGTVLHDLHTGRALTTVMVTSALPREGKTLTVVNLAVTLSDAFRRRVLVIDADLRRPSVHPLFDVANDRGLSDVLDGEARDVPIVEVTPTLSVLPAGRSQSTPLAGLSSPRMKSLLEELSSRYDYVVLDTPPVGLLPDAQLLARMTEAVIFVIRAGVTPYSVVQRAIAEVGTDCIVGTVLNAVEEDAIPAAGYYSQYYGADAR